MEVQGEHQDKELVSTRSRLEMETAKKPSMATLDSQGWKSAVQTRMYEEKIRGMEADLEKKVRTSNVAMKRNNQGIGGNMQCITSFSNPRIFMFLFYMIRAG